MLAITKALLQSAVAYVGGYGMSLVGFPAPIGQTHFCRVGGRRIGNMDTIGYLIFVMAMHGRG